MIRPLEHYIKEIDWIVWNYNSYHDNNRDWETPFHINTKEVAETIMEFAKMIVNCKNKKSPAIKSAVDEINKYVRPVDYKESSMNKLYPKSQTHFESDPIYQSKRIIEYCQNILDVDKTASDVSMEQLNKDWCGKYIYFNGDESGEQIIVPRKIYYKGDDIVFDGAMIELANENSCNGIGVIVSEVEEYLFENLHYINYISEKYVEDEELEDEDIIYPAKLQAMLLSKPIDTNLPNRLMTKEEVDEAIRDHINYGLSEKIWE